MTKDPLYQAELAHDTSGLNAEPFLAESLTSIVEDLMHGEKPRGLGWSLHDFYKEQDDLAELAAALTISGDLASFRDMIEGRLRRALEDDDATHDLAAQFAGEPEES